VAFVLAPHADEEDLTGEAEPVRVRPGRSCKITPRHSPAEKAAVRIAIRFRDGSGGDAYLPNHERVSFVSRPSMTPGIAELASAEAAIVELGAVASLFAWLRCLFTRKRKYKLFLPGLELILAGPTRPRRLLANASRFLEGNGMRIDGEAVRAHPELYAGFENFPDRYAPVAAPTRGPLKLAVALHLYYDELWPEFEAALRAAPQAFDLIVTHSGRAADLEQRIRRTFPDAKVHLLENRGRDLYPFLWLLEQGALDDYDAVCKIHGKRSIKASPIIGEMWRRKMLLDLIAGQGALDRVVEAFASDPRLGLIGPKGFRQHKSPVAADAWLAETQSPRHILAALGGDPADFKDDFFAGTMFWVRPAALAALKPHRFSSVFDAETGGVYVGLEVAFETTFNAIVNLAGYGIGEIDAFELERG
jgi:hypothetical protein